MKNLVQILLVIVASSPLWSRSITFDDVYSIPSYDDVQISPDGASIVFALAMPNAKANTSHTHLFMMDAAGGEPRQLTFGDFDNGHPRWSPDGKAIYFLSDREGTAQIWRLSLEGGGPQLIAALPADISEFECFSKGPNLVYVARTYPDCHTDSCTQSRQKETENEPVKARIYDELLFRHYSRWNDGLVNRLYAINPGDRTGREIYSGPYDAPTTLLEGGRDFDVSPDGTEMTFSMNTDSTPAIWPDNSLFRIVLPDEKPVRLTSDPGLEISPRYSPDGRFLAYVATARAGYESDQRDLIVYDRQIGGRRNLTETFDRSVGEYVWSPDGQSIFFTAIDRGFSKVWCVDVATGKILLFLDDAVYSGIRVSPNGDFLIFMRSLADQPYELYRYDIDDGELRRLTFFTDPIMKDLDLSHAEEFWFKGAFGDSVHGFLTLPPGFDSSRTYPLALLIHGGPQWCWLGDFNYYGWNTQLTAAQGYVVAQINPHGSVGYGLAFKEYVSGHWGQGDYEDLMMGVDYLLARYPFIDSTRMAALGRSYGGFMTNWICGHTDRFRCLITIDGPYDQVSGYGSTDELWFPEWEFKGTPYDNWDEYVRASPVRYAVNFKTPTMIIHGGHDYRVDPSEGLQMFTALRRLGVPAKLLYYPDEGHNVQGIRNLRYVYENQFEWLKRWLNP